MAAEIEIEPIEWLTDYRDPHTFSAEAFKALVLESLAHNSSDIFIQPNRPVYVDVSGRLGAITRRKVLDREVEDILKWVCNRDNAFGKILGGGALNARYEVFDPVKRNEYGQKIRYGYRVNATPILSMGSVSCQIVIRAIPSNPPFASNIGLKDDILSAVTPRDGIVYIAGGTGSGKTTTFAAIIRHILENDTPVRGNIVTYEEPIEFVYANVKSSHSNIVQTEVPGMIATFGDGIREAMRRKPKLIMIGELRDQETILAALEASMTGHTVFGTVHANNVAGVAKRLISRFPENQRSTAIYDIADTVRFIMAQKLVRTKEGKLTAAREYLRVTKELRDEIQDLPDMGRVTSKVAELVEREGNSFRKEAERLYDEGIIDEHVRRGLYED